MHPSGSLFFSPSTPKRRLGLFALLLRR